jgi:carbamoyl-phosphate synthase large subunit
VRDEDKPRITEALRGLHEGGFRIVATPGTARYLKERGIGAEPVNRVRDGSPHVVDLIASRAVDLVIVTTRIADSEAVRDSASMRRTALEHGIAYFTTAAGARAAAAAIRALRDGDLVPIALQDLYPSV